MAEEPCKINTAVNHCEPLFYHYTDSDDDANSTTDNAALLGIQRSYEDNKKKAMIASVVLDKTTQGVDPRGG